MELDRALHSAVILAWDDLMKANVTCPVRVEYQGKPGLSLESVSVWLAKAWGYHDLLCDYWTSASSSHPSGICFKDRYSSDKLTEALDLIMKHQDQFTRPVDSGCSGLVLIDPPTADETREAANWMNEVRGSASVTCCR